MFDKIIRAGIVAVVAVAGLYLHTAVRIPDRIYLRHGQEIQIQSVPAVTLDKGQTGKTQRDVSYDDSQLYTARFMGIFPVKDVAVVRTEQRYVNVSGKPFGIKMFCDGVMVVGFSDILTHNGYENPAKAAGIKAGDVITRINDVKMHTNEDVEKAVTRYGDNPVKVSLLRGEKEITVIMQAVRDKTTGNMRSGMWVRDSGAGIGTMTFYDSETGYFAGLGHGIKDVDTRQELRLLSGEIVPVKITGIVKSRNGSAGQLKGNFTTTAPSGRLLHNGPSGVYGKAYRTDCDNIMPVADPASVKTGDAYILTTINNSTPQLYTAEIEKVNLTASDKNKNMVIRITDTRLLTLTGGIVAGMSGSPVIQDGKLVGAVTHVFINNVERGYGIFARNMLETMDSIAYSEEHPAA